MAEWIDGFAHQIDLPPKALAALQISLEEIAINVIRHGYPQDGPPKEFTVTLDTDHDYVIAVVTDDAPAFNPSNQPEVDISLPLERRPIGGLGIHMVKHLMDSVHYERRGSQNILTMRRLLKDTPALTTPGSADTKM